MNVLKTQEYASPTAQNADLIEESDESESEKGESESDDENEGPASQSDFLVEIDKPQEDPLEFESNQVNISIQSSLIQPSSSYQPPSSINAPLPEYQSNEQLGVGESSHNPSALYGGSIPDQSVIENEMMNAFSQRVQSSLSNKTNSIKKEAPPAAIVEPSPASRSRANSRANSMARIIMDDPIPTVPPLEPSPASRKNSVKMLNQTSQNDTNETVFQSNSLQDQVDQVKSSLPLDPYTSEQFVKPTRNMPMNLLQDINNQKEAVRLSGSFSPEMYNPPKVEPVPEGTKPAIPYEDLITLSKRLKLPELVKVSESVTVDQVATMDVIEAEGFGISRDAYFKLKRYFISRRKYV